ncbi:hypothetical protein GZ77_14880 [Endozoicomonas montiporae]|uniref:Uncharacterized protein n=1 Tax=Endozoicomonas montiporae TaxID=1027273 RepID=A0A081N577_9GAMM|nr:hypothetical protein GZ77_14880 [Endozoicomonas montiporae]
MLPLVRSWKCELLCEPLRTGLHFRLQTFLQTIRKVNGLFLLVACCLYMVIKLGDCVKAGSYADHGQHCPFVCRLVDRITSMLLTVTIDG